jgi:hypothetical protein
MAVESNLECKTYEAGEDMSATGQFKFVKFDGNLGDTGCPRVIICTALTDRPAGVLQDKPTTVGEACLIAVRGETKVQADASLTVGTPIGTSADGQADAKTAGTDTTEYVVGHVTLAAGAAGRIASAYIDCTHPNRAA